MTTRTSQTKQIFFLCFVQKGVVAVAVSRGLEVGSDPVRL